MVELQSSGSVNNAIAEVSAELQRERQKNAQLMKRISILEAQMQGRDEDPLVSGEKVFAQTTMEKKSKKMKVARNGEINRDDAMRCVPEEDLIVTSCMVNWMHMNEADVFHPGTVKQGDRAADSEDTDNSDEEGESREEVDTESFVSSEPVEEQKVAAFVRKEGINPGILCVDSSVETQKHDQGIKKKPSKKVAFCPKEVRRLMESEELLEKNAQSHTIRKIIVFASLGIRHGCEDMYELDFNHFSILSSKDIGEHVLYENPGISWKIFYPNRQNPTLCPVQILEEEKAMRPSDDNCPSCLFLCIKYGGRTRNIPQTEYVRQRMGRNKLKSFGPAICQMAKLVHIRGGSFFFKALGITLLFMAGFPNDLVQKEAKYRNLDLLQKYYRTDEDAEEDELFLSHPVITDTNDISKTTSKRLKCKRKSATAEKSSIPGISSQFELNGYASNQNPGNTATKKQHCHQCDQSSHPGMPQFMPMMYWLPCPHPSLHSFRYPVAGNYISMYPQPHYGSALPDNPIPQPSKGYWKKNRAASENADSESHCCSNNTEPKNITH